MTLDDVGDLARLRRAWHVARDDTRIDYVPDPFRHTDFGYNVDSFLHSLSESLRARMYRPKPLVPVDSPKSRLFNRPGVVLDIEDRTVLFSVLELIGPTLDKLLPEEVKSSRVKKDDKGRVSVNNAEPLETRLSRIPFLKGKTIRQRISIWEPWYKSWPEFQEDLLKVSTEGRFPYIVTSDVAAYFENIDLGILHQMLLRNAPDAEEVITFLTQVLEQWSSAAMSSPHGGRGIPQGNGVSSFLGNLYLRPVDQALASARVAADLEYRRWMDDFEIFVRSEDQGRQIVSLISNTLRFLRLNINERKTQVLSASAEAERFSDSRLTLVNEVINEAEKQALLKPEIVSSLAARLDDVREKLALPRELTDRDLRLYRRLLTGYTLLGDSRLAGVALEQVMKTYDHRTIQKTSRYLASLSTSDNGISARIWEYLSNADAHSPYFIAELLRSTRYLRTLNPAIRDLAYEFVIDPQKPWLVRQEAIQLLAQVVQPKAKLRVLRDLYGETGNVDVRRALLMVLCQTARDEYQGPLDLAVKSGDPRLRRTAQFYLGLMKDRIPALRHATDIFRDTDEEYFVDRIAEIEVLSKSEHHDVLRRLAELIDHTCGTTGRPILEKRLLFIRRRLPGKAPHS